MKPITYLQGDATSPQATGPKIIAHVSNDAGGWGKGFVLAISKRWSEPEKQYRSWYRARSQNDFALGAVQIVPVQSDVWVANMIGQHGTKTKNNPLPVRYEAIEKCLAHLANQARELNASVHMPRIGCGLAGGRWDKVQPLILQQLSALDIPVFVYDFAG